jgi:hypothetical protein
MAAIDGEHFEELLADLEAALQEVVSAVDREPGLWTRGLPGKWTAGQHASHLSLTIDATAASFEERADLLRRGELLPCPHRGILQSIWVFVVVRRGKMPRGGKTPGWFVPPASPDREGTLQALRSGLHRHGALGSNLTPDERDRLWIPNPFHSRWHYTLPEILRVHAIHARHHIKLISEISSGA